MKLPRMERLGAMLTLIGKKQKHLPQEKRSLKCRTRRYPAAASLMSYGRIDPNLTLPTGCSGPQSTKQYTRFPLPPQITGVRNAKSVALSPP
jgi:hypothetical protein